MPKIEVCLTPDLLHLFELKGKNVVVVDILRATSCMVTGFAHGIEAVIPVAKVEECKKLQEAGHMAAAERDGLKLEGFDLDNSPFSYMSPGLAGKCIAVTTTNGTQAIAKSTEADEIIIGAFLNISAVANYLEEQQKDTVILCAGWKGNYNLEDTLFAGALTDILKDSFTVDQDAALGALSMYTHKKGELLPFVMSASHVKRLARLNITKDIEFCVSKDVYNALPVYKEGKLINLKTTTV